MQEDGKKAKKSILKPIKWLQNKCLRRITGGYKRTPTAALEREASIAPLDLYVQATALQRAAATAKDPMEEDIGRVVNDIWDSTHKQRTAYPTQLPRLPMLQERLKARVSKTVSEMRTKMRTKIMNTGAFRRRRKRRIQRVALQRGGHYA